MIAAKIGQTAIDAHPGTSSDQNRFGIGDHMGSPVESLVDHRFREADRMRSMVRRQECDHDRWRAGHCSLFLGPDGCEILGGLFADAVVREDLVSGLERLLVVEDNRLG